MIKLCNIRQFATAIKKKAEKEVNTKVELIKNLNFENKALYGAVVKARKPKVSSSHNVRNDKSTASPSTANSELFWLMKNQNPKAQRNITIASTFEEPEQTEPQSSLEIPFKDSELKLITTFPLKPSESGLLEKSWTRSDHLPKDRYKLPSVSKILTATMPESSRQALLRWKASKVALLGEEGFEQFQKEIFERGKNFHSCLESWLAEQEPAEADINKADKLWTSIGSHLGRIGRPASLIEQRLSHPFLHYTGVVDCVTIIDNRLHIIEWKTSESQKPSLAATYDAPVQLCAYLGALRADPEFSKLDIVKGAVLVAYTDGQPAHAHGITGSQLKKYWNVWLQRLQEYWTRYRDNTLPDPI
ncbi:mitochondrial genome maintenance exonuclease 1-like [Uranotaenia lowii]|uniref:mitochondrial genome maintenance exonuclease 1-like n=1 Tax=Uranotaenia lowii TaxID=190385 RepID=UPI0024784DF5|nr:mitochondrial genome maintenance exonuclease 1-like [Uranotaenia lowii]XP_055597994.1 mitochondrial genome maintenance exonuclease 1-like [Uranotaenia lowii]